MAGHLQEEMTPGLPNLSLRMPAMYWAQQSNGMWSRATLIAHNFDVQARIVNYSSN
jgi:hypothetical protein